jgi:hypothetical protein
VRGANTLFQAFRGVEGARQCCRALAALLVSTALAHAQKYDISALLGGTLGGTVQLEQLDVPHFDARVANSFSFALAGGFRFDSEFNNCKACALVEFRWLRQGTHLALTEQNPFLPTPTAVSSFHPSLTLNHFLGDFTQEFPIGESSKVRPFAMASLGAVRMTTPEAGATRFVFGIGAGVNIFPKPHWGIRLQAEYLPILMRSELERVVCTTGCIVIGNVGIMNQFVLSAGPTFRFK